jgi:hypothetical protein
VNVADETDQWTSDQLAAPVTGCRLECLAGLLTFLIIALMGRR